MDVNFIRDRVTELRMRKGVSEYKMSYDLGHNKNYVRCITSGISMPSVRGLLDICEYFEMTPAQFFDKEYPEIIRKVQDGMIDLDEEDLLLVLNIVQRLNKDKRIKG